ncbi:MAG: VWA domain-containing protein [Alistipes sp.]|nr:VWA domain-containing protein [Alistipes sp.]
MYTQEITRHHRAAFVLVLDQSTSMQQQVQFGRLVTTKSQVVAYTANSLITELVDRCRRSEGIRDYYDIAVFGYSGDEVKSLLPRDGFNSIAELARQMPDITTVAFEEDLPDGTQAIVHHRQREWIKPLAEGTTPMHEALHKVRDVVDEWCSNPLNRESFPPIVINITDGEPTDCTDMDLRDVCTLIKRTATEDGNTLLINIHISTDTRLNSVIFPMHEELTRACDKARLLADCSSVMPSALNEAIHELKGVGAIPPYIGIGYNATVVELLSMINIGSRSITQLE